MGIYAESLQKQNKQNFPNHNDFILISVVLIRVHVRIEFLVFR